MALFIVDIDLCQLHVLVNGLEEVSFNATDIGLSAQAQIIKFRRMRADPIKVWFWDIDLEPAAGHTCAYHSIVSRQR